MLCSEKLDVLDHYVAWRQTHDMPQHASGTDGPFSFCSYPFLLNPRAKSKLLHTEARIQMDQVGGHGNGCLVSGFGVGVGCTGVPLWMQCECWVHEGWAPQGRLCVCHKP